MKYWIWLSKVSENINKNKIRKILYDKKTPQKIYECTKNELINYNLTTKEIEAIASKNSRKDLEKYEDYIIKNKINLITYHDSKYPYKLKQIYDSPLVLFTKGNIDILSKKSIAIVGSRFCTKYGKKISYNFANELSKQNINIISGLAKGIDSYAHIGAYKNVGRTIAVMASGFDLIYPEENRNLFNQILLNDGLVITEHLPYTPLTPEKFVQRNRLISAISDGVLVVEAGEKSGVFSTVDFALEHNKEVYVIPGNIDSKTSVGTNKLIKQGACLITSVNEIIEIIDDVKC